MLWIKNQNAQLMSYPYPSSYSDWLPSPTNNMFYPSNHQEEQNCHGLLFDECSSTHSEDRYSEDYNEAEEWKEILSFISDINPNSFHQDYSSTIFED